MSEEIENGPIVLKASGKKRDMVHLFTIEYDEDRATDFFAPSSVGFNITLQAMKVYAERGEMAALYFSMEHLFGKEAFEELMAFEELTQEQFDAIATYAEKVVIAPGKSKNLNRMERRARERKQQ